MKEKTIIELVEFAPRLEGENLLSLARGRRPSSSGGRNLYIWSHYTGAKKTRSGNISCIGFSYTSTSLLVSRHRLVKTQREFSQTNDKVSRAEQGVNIIFWFISNFCLVFLLKFGILPNSEKVHVSLILQLLIRINFHAFTQRLQNARNFIR